jgi:hypothetical protein
MAIAEGGPWSGCEEGVFRVEDYRVGALLDVQPDSTYHVVYSFHMLAIRTLPAVCLDGELCVDTATVGGQECQQDGPVCVCHDTLSSDLVETGVWQVDDEAVVFEPDGPGRKSGFLYSLSHYCQFDERLLIENLKEDARQPVIVAEFVSAP